MSGEKLEQEADNAADLSRKRIKRSTRNEDINKCLLEFFRRCRDNNIPLTVVIIQDKSKFYADSFGVTDFEASNGWLQGWKYFDLPCISKFQINTPQDVDNTLSSLESYCFKSGSSNLQ